MNHSSNKIFGRKKFFEGNVRDGFTDKQSELQYTHIYIYIYLGYFKKTYYLKINIILSKINKLKCRKIYR